MTSREEESIFTPTRSDVSRRQLLKMMGITGLSFGAAAALGVDPFSRSAGRSEAEAASAAEAAPIELNVWATGTMSAEEYYADLEEKSNIRVIFTDNGNNTGPIINKLVFGNANDLYDVGGLQGGAEKELAAQGAIAPWDMSKIPNFEQVWKWAKEIPYTVIDGERYAIPAIINADSMIYLPDKVGEVTSYETVFDPKLKGKTAMEDAWTNSGIFTAIYLKENGLAKINDPGNLSEDELGEVMEFLIKHKKDGQFRTFWDGWEQGVQLITSQEVWVMTGWEPIVYAAQRAGVNAMYAVPREGYEGWSNDLLLLKGAVDRGTSDAAHTFANWELGGHYGSAISKLRGYVVPTDVNVEYAKAHSDQFDPEFQAELQDHVKQKFFSMKGSVYWQNVRPDNLKLYEEWWQKLKNV